MVNDELYDLLTRIGNPNGWNRDHQLENFSNLIRLSDLAKKPISQSKVLDVGCGTGELYNFLQCFNVLDYWGVDIYIPSLEIARREKPRAILLNRDILIDRDLPLFDYVFASGSLSTRVDDNYSFLEQMVTRMNEIAKRGVYFNFLTDNTSLTDELLFYYNPVRVQDICRRKGQKRVMVENDSERNEGHVFLY